MTTQKQTDANRRNALLSTGPRTENGKRQSRGNAYRHGLTAETVVAGLEDAVDYGAFEAEIVSEYDPHSVIERELTHRLASLLWRLRRAGLIETGLFRSGIERKRPRQNGRNFARKSDKPISNSVIRWFGTSNNPVNCSDPNGGRTTSGSRAARDDNSDISYVQASRRRSKQQAMTVSFFRLATLPSAPLERVNRYEASLWRQFVQVLFSLDQAKYHRIAASRGRFTPHAPQW